jgi:hypothetical protein
VKRSVRYVLVDDGYGPAECWYRVKVVGSQMCKDLFGGPDKEQLLVQYGDGTRKWAAFWQEIPSEAKEA